MDAPQVKRLKRNDPETRSLFDPTEIEGAIAIGVDVSIWDHPFSITDFNRLAPAIMVRQNVIVPIGAARGLKTWHDYLVGVTALSQGPFRCYQEHCYSSLTQIAFTAVIAPWMVLLRVNKKNQSCIQYRLTQVEETPRLFESKNSAAIDRAYDFSVLSIRHQLHSQRVRGRQERICEKVFAIKVFGVDEKLHQIPKTRITILSSSRAATKAPHLRRYNGSSTDQKTQTKWSGNNCRFRRSCARA